MVRRQLRRRSIRPIRCWTGREGCNLLPKVRGHQRSASNFVEAGIARVFLGLLRVLPYPWRIRFGGWIFQVLVGPLTGQRKRIAHNLDLVWPDLPRDARKKLIAQVPNYVGRTLIELFSPDEFSARAKKAPIEGAGLEALQQCRETGRGAILVSGHFGNYDVVRAGLTAAGYDVGALYRPMNNGYFNDLYVKTITQIAQPLFPRGRAGMSDMVRFLKRGGALALLIDQHMGDGEDLSFFGKTARTATSAAKMAIKYDVPLIPFYSVRQPDGLNFKLVLEAPIEGDDPIEMTQALNDSLETQVRAHPQQWLWTHLRWKAETGR